MTDAMIVPSAPNPYPTRQQLTLFVQSDGREEMERIRRAFNPAQYHLIAAHVTLCREDEIINMERVLENIRQIRLANPLRITFGPVERFEEGKGVWLPASAANAEFDALRKEVLRGVDDAPRPHRAHLTLLHPRNATCTDPIFDQIKQVEWPTELFFSKISWIEQVHGFRWKTLDEFPLLG